MNFFSIFSFILIASSLVNTCKGDNFMWMMGSYDSVDIEVGESITLNCGHNGKRILNEFQDREAFAKCDTTRAAVVAQTNKDGSRTVAFTEAGTRYFGCKMNNSCSQSTKLKVTVQPKGTAPKTHGKKKFVITKGAQCKKGKVLDKIKNKTLRTCLFICRKTIDCHGFKHRAFSHECILYAEPTYPKRRMGGVACGWRIFYPDNSGNDGGENSLQDAITVNLFLTENSKTGGKVLLKLYLYDKRLADVSASLVAEYFVQVPPRARISPESVKLFIDPYVTQAGNTFEEMVEGAYYIALDSGESDLTYSSGPVFDIAPNDNISFILKNEH